MRAGWYTTGAALSILFLFPLVWGGYESLHGQPGSGQESGYGFGNYTRMAEYGVASRRTWPTRPRCRS